MWAIHLLRGKYRIIEYFPFTRRKYRTIKHVSNARLGKPKEKGQETQIVEMK